jgi:hypothetical protein
LQIYENIGKWKLLKCGNCKLPFSLSFETTFLLIPSTNKREEILNLPTFSSTFGINILPENEDSHGNSVVKNSQKTFFIQQKFTSMFETEKFEMQKRIKKFEMEQKKLFDLKFKNALVEKERIIQVISGLPISNEKILSEESEIKVQKEKVKIKQTTSEKKEVKITKTIPKVKEINNASDEIFSFDQEDAIQNDQVLEEVDEESEEEKPPIEPEAGGEDEIQEEEIRRKREEFLYSSSVPVNIPMMKKIPKEEENFNQEEEFSYIERYEEIRK